MFYFTVGKVHAHDLMFQCHLLAGLPPFNVNGVQIGGFMNLLLLAISMNVLRDAIASKGHSVLKYSFSGSEF